LINFRKSLFISISVLVIGLSTYGLVGNDAYSLRTNNMTTFEIYGQDIVSLVIGLTLFVLSITKNNSINKIIIRLGSLVYIAYTYAYFSFGLLTTKLYILYLVVLSISFFLLILHVLELLKTDQVIDGKQYTNKAVSIYIFIVVGIVGVMDLKELLIRTVINRIQMNPQIVFCVLDLSILFPAMVISAYLNIKRRLVGVILLGVFLVKTIVLMPALILSDLLHFSNLGTFVDSTFDIIALVILISAIAFYGIHISKIKRFKIVT
jgi:hypothetical protein